MIVSRALKHKKVISVFPVQIFIDVSFASM
jgi:hypothetical protein